MSFHLLDKNTVLLFFNYSIFARKITTTSIGRKWICDCIGLTRMGEHGEGMV